MSDINLPAQYDKSDQAVVTNLSNNGGKFTGGWEMILFNVSYNPNSSGVCTLNITSGAKLNFSVNLFADLESTSTGTITTYSQSNSAATLVNKLSNKLGDDAANALEKKFGLNSSRGLLGSIISTVLDKGLNKIFKSFIARHNKTQKTVQDLQFTTHTTATITGTLSSDVSSTPYVGTFSLPADKAKLLGNWNLRETPTVYIHPVGIMVATYPGYPTEYQYAFTASGNYKYDLVVHPELKKYIKSQSVEITPVDYVGSSATLIPGNKTVLSDRGSMTTNSTSGVAMPYTDGCKELVNINMDSNNRLVIREDPMRATMIYYGIPNDDPATISAWPYTKYVFAPQHKVYQRGEFKYYKDYYRLKVTVTMTANFGGDDITCVTTRTYIPKIEFDPTLVSWYTGCDLASLYQDAERDSRLNPLRGFTYPLQGGLMKKVEKPKKEDIKEK